MKLLKVRGLALGAIAALGFSTMALPATAAPFSTDLKALSASGYVVEQVTDSTFGRHVSATMILTPTTQLSWTLEAISGNKGKGAIGKSDSYWNDPTMARHDDTMSFAGAVFQVSAAVPMDAYGSGHHLGVGSGKLGADADPMIVRDSGRSALPALGRGSDEHLLGKKLSDAAVVGATFQSAASDDMTNANFSAAWINGHAPPLGRGSDLAMLDRSTSALHANASV